MTTHYQDLHAAIAGMAVVDTHEHLPSCESATASPADFLSTYLTHYISSDLLSAGLAPEDLARARDTALPPATRWALVAPYWERCRLTGYGRALDIAAELLYGIHGIYSDTVEALQRAYAASCGQDHMKRVLQDRCHIACALLDSDWSTPLDTRLFFRGSGVRQTISSLNGAGNGRCHGPGKPFAHARRCRTGWMPATGPWRKRLPRVP